jgi:hypothetical protein
MNENRKHFRLAANLPLDIRLPIHPDRPLRRVSSNVSAGGVYFQAHLEDDVQPGQRINLRIAIPPAVGRLETEGILEGQATVLRVDPLKNTRAERLGIACEFTEPLHFA